MKDIPVRKLKHQATEPLLSRDFDIRDLSTVMGKKAMVQELHRHDYFFLLVIHKGKGKHEIDFQPFDVQGPCVFFMRPGQVHQLQLHVGCQGYVLEFKPGFYRQSDKLTSMQWRSLHTYSLYTFTPKSFSRIWQTVCTLYEEHTSRNEGYIEMVKSYLDILFLLLYRHHTISAGPPTTISHVHDQVNRFLELIDTHMATHKQVAEYAGMMNLSVYQLNALTKKSLGKSASEIIIEHTLLEARRYLLATTNQVSQIAYQLGYEDVSYFIRFFKKYMSVTPEAYRKQFS